MQRGWYRGIQSNDNSPSPKFNLRNYWEADRFPGVITQPTLYESAPRSIHMSISIAMNLQLAILKLQAVSSHHWRCFYWPSLPYTAAGAGSPVTGPPAGPVAVVLFSGYVPSEALTLPYWVKAMFMRP